MWYENNLLSGLIGAIIGGIITYYGQIQVENKKSKNLTEINLKLVCRRLISFSLECINKLNEVCIVEDQSGKLHFMDKQGEKYFRQNKMDLLPELILFDNNTTGVFNNKTEESLIELHQEIDDYRRRLGDFAHYFEKNTVLIFDYNAELYFLDIYRLLNKIVYVLNEISKLENIQVNGIKNLKDYLVKMQELDETRGSDITNAVKI